MHKLMPKLQAQGSRVLIFSQMIRMREVLKDDGSWKEYSHNCIDGGTAYEDRQRQIHEHDAPGSSKFIFTLTTRTGGLGINPALSTSGASMTATRARRWTTKMQKAGCQRVNSEGAQCQMALTLPPG